MTSFSGGDKLGRESPKGGHMPKEQRIFTKEFKLEAVQLVQRSGKSQTQVARSWALPIVRCTTGARNLRITVIRHLSAAGIRRPRKKSCDV